MYFTAAWAAGTSELSSMLAVLPSVMYPILTGVPVAAFGVPRTPGTAALAWLAVAFDDELLLHAASVIANTAARGAATFTDRSIMNRLDLHRFQMSSASGAVVTA